MCPDVRGLAVKMYLPDGSRYDIVAQSAPRFPTHGPDGFVELLRAQRRPAALWKMPLWLARNPSAVAGLPRNLAALRFMDSDGGSRYVRYTWIPEAGDVRIGAREAKSRGPDYLQEDIRRRVQQGSVRFWLELQIAGPRDDVNDPAAAWPSERERVRAGTLELTAIDTEREQGDDVLVFDPTREVDGIELSDDPVLRFRRDAYADSVARRVPGGG